MMTYILILLAGNAIFMLLGARYELKHTRKDDEG